MRAVLYVEMCCVGGYLGMLFEWFMFVGGCVVCGLCYISELYSVLGWGGQLLF